MNEYDHHGKSHSPLAAELVLLLFIIYTFPQNQAKQKRPLITPHFLLVLQVFIHQEATAPGSCLSL